MSEGGVSDARAVVLEFRMRNLQQAEAICKQVLDETKKAANLSAEARKDLIARTKADLAEIRAQKAQVLGLQKDLAAGKSIGPLDALREPLRVANQVREKGQAVLNVLQGSTGGIAGLARLVGGPAVGGIVMLVLPLINEAIEVYKKGVEQERRLQEVQLENRLRELEERLDYAGRLESDPEFRRQQSRVAFDETVADEAARAKSGIPPQPFDEDF